MSNVQYGHTLNLRTTEPRNETISTMSHKENFLVDASVDTTPSTELLDTGNVEDTPNVAVPKPKKSKRFFSRCVTKRGLLVDDDTFSPPKLSIDNDGSDNVEESTDMPQEPRRN